MVIALRKEIIDILKIKNNTISLQIIEVIEIFNVEELIELKLILKQDNPDKLKEALIYKHWLLEKTLDKIINMQKEFHQIKNEYESKKRKKENEDLDSSLDTLLNSI